MKVFVCRHNSRKRLLCEKCKEELSGVVWLGGVREKGQCEICSKLSEVQTSNDPAFKEELKRKMEDDDDRKKRMGVGDDKVH